MMFYQHYNKRYVNPYRTGVKIGNYNEDLFGQELQEKYKNARPNQKMYISETMDKYKWPQLQPQHVHVAGNEMTMTQNSNFDLNLDINNNNLRDYFKLQEKNKPFTLQDKNKFLSSQIIEEQKMKQINKETGFTESNAFPTKEEMLQDEMQGMLGKYHIKDTNGIMYTTNSGLNSKLLFGHGDQKDFNKTEYVTTNQLILGDKEKTDKILDPHYRTTKTYQRPQSAKFDDRDWGFRKYKIYEDFTKKYDRPNNLMIEKTG